MHVAKKSEEKAKEEVIELLQKQITVEATLIQLYEESAKEIESSAVKHLLRMIHLDSLKHIESLQVIIDVLQGEEVLKKEKEQILKGLRRHIELERDSLSKAGKIMSNVWIRETKGLKELVKRWMSDEKEHITILEQMMAKPFFRISPDDFVALLKNTEELEERYMKFRKRTKNE